jgi:hypothetical protein
MPGSFEECQFELGEMAHDLGLSISASYWENEISTISAPSTVSAVETFYVKVEWSLTGHLSRHFCGKWQVKIDFESIGTAQEYSSSLVTIDMDPCLHGPNNPYSYTFTITSGTVKPAPGGTVYLVAVTISSLDPCGDPGHIWGFCKGPSVMFVP